MARDFCPVVKPRKEMEATVERESPADHVTSIRAASERPLRAMGHRDLTGVSRAATFLTTGGALPLAVTAAVAYYVGSLIGLQLRLRPATPSVLWPPNAILTA